MSIKLQLGKLILTLPLADVIASQQQLNQLEVLHVNLQHVLALDSLPGHHKDPFDRLLIAQANVEDVVLISRDSVFGQYPVNVQW
jgi:PIN domain nuclease of toxin-antitoxin system